MSEHVNQEIEYEFNTVYEIAEEWNKPVQDDEELLEKHGFDAETKEYIDFNPEVEFRKSNFELKVVFGNQQHLARRVRAAKRALESSFNMDNQVVVVAIDRVQSSQPIVCFVLNKLRAKRLNSS
ncbi:hypothetical protein ACH5RR_024387 [Cinchona calisaya]|uniref:Uncharacterized protein n=1 Tax=Cinchona calisaya TaxID=153742 RepID=A0ABD2YWI1_9GENT